MGDSSALIVYQCNALGVTDSVSSVSEVTDPAFYRTMDVEELPRLIDDAVSRQFLESDSGQ